MAPVPTETATSEPADPEARSSPSENGSAGTSGGMRRSRILGLMLVLVAIVLIVAGSLFVTGVIRWPSSGPPAPGPAFDMVAFNVSYTGSSALCTVNETGGVASCAPNGSDVCRWYAADCPSDLDAGTTYAVGPNLGVGVAALIEGSTNCSARYAITGVTSSQEAFRLVSVVASNSNSGPPFYVGNDSSPTGGCLQAIVLVLEFAVVDIGPIAQGFNVTVAAAQVL
ncbi:MAG TPA: hypothetical protein VEL82_05320 [Thermoplasmata archaeon]|nr:hypothetical protein [Thermoplasmata archaeon]